MKKYLFILTFLISSLSAQSQGVRFSFIANPQFAWFSGNDDNYESNGIFLGFNTGLEMDFFFSENYAFSTGITINNLKGGAIYSDSLVFDIGDKDKILIPDSRLTYNLQYLSVPLGLKFKTIEIGYSTYWLNTGITPMVRLKARATDETEYFEKENIITETRLFNINYFIEGGLEYSLGGNTALIAGLGYYTGFTDVTEKSNYRLTTQSFAVIFGILF